MYQDVEDCWILNVGMQLKLLTDTAPDKRGRDVQSVELADSWRLESMQRNVSFAGGSILADYISKPFPVNRSTTSLRGRQCGRPDRDLSEPRRNSRHLWARNLQGLVLASAPTDSVH